MPEVCPLLTAPKPQVIMHGLINEGLLFFEQPTSETYKPKIDSARMAMLTVTGGDLSIPQIVSQLQRLVPLEQFHWDVQQVGHNVFKVPFPSKSELERLAIFGACKVPGGKCEITVVPWVATVEPMEMLPKKWVRVYGIPPKTTGDFLSLWSLGSLFGKTFKVDMKFTRKHGVLRILVGCVDYTLIPAGWTIFIKDGFYRLKFKVEHPVDVADKDDDEPRSPPPPGDDDDSADEGSNNQEKEERDKENKTTDDMVTDDNTKGSAVKDSGGAAAPDDMQEKLSGVVFSPMVRKQFQLAKQELLSLVQRSSGEGKEEPRVDDSNSAACLVVDCRGSNCDKSCSGSFSVLRDCADSGERGGVLADPVLCVSGSSSECDGVISVGGELDSGTRGDAGSDHGRCSEKGSADNGTSQRWTTPIRPMAPSSSPVLPMEVAGGLYMDRLGNTVVSPPQSCGHIITSEAASGRGARPSESEMMAFGGMHEVEVRSSQRLREQQNADLPQLERAMDLTSRKI